MLASWDLPLRASMPWLWVAVPKAVKQVSILVSRSLWNRLSTSVSRSLANAKAEVQYPQQEYFRPWLWKHKTSILVIFQTYVFKNSFVCVCVCTCARASARHVVGGGTVFCEIGIATNSCLAWNSLWTCTQPSFSASLVPGLQACDTIPGHRRSGNSL